MISKMLNYTFLVHHGEFNSFLEILRKTGVVHIKEKSEGTPDNEEILSKIKLSKKTDEAIKFLKLRKVAGGQAANHTDAGLVIAEIEQLREKIETENNKLQGVNKKINQLKHWGDFSWETVKKLQSANKHIFFFTCNKSKFAPAWAQQFNLFEISRAESMLYFVIVSDSAETPKIEADILKLPTECLSGLEAEKQNIARTIEKLNSEIDGFASTSINALQNYSARVKSEIDFSKVVLNADSSAAEKVKIVEGWVPEQNVNEITHTFDELGVLYLRNEPSLSERVPVLLKNNAFTKLFEMVGSLYSLPDYREIDLTPFFAPFFMLFFGFCLGDAGYGLLMMLATLILRGKAKPNLKPVWTLGFFFGLATLLMGILGGTFFGVMLVELEFNWLATLQGIMLDQNQLMAFSVMLGLIQIVFGICLKAARAIKMQGIKHAVSTFGWLIIIVGTGGSFALGRFGFIDQQVAHMLMLITGIAGAIPALFFNSPGKNLFMNFGLGLWDTYSMVTGLLGDVLSYIRLFALGLSSAILGNVFNQLAFDLTGSVPVLSQLLTVAILLLGHSINFFMAALGAFVHPLRLTFVEFFKNTGFSGGGLKYKPFSEPEEVKY